MKRAFGYVRVSLESENPENQVKAIEEFAKANGIELLKVFQDIGVSGSKPAFEREEFLKMYEAARLLDVKTVIVLDLTRLGRDLFDLIETYKRLLEEGFTILFVKHPELNAPEEKSPISEAVRKALLTLLAVAAEMERAFIRERTKAAMERLRKEGKKLGRPQYPFPADEVRRLLDQGYSVSEIHRLLTLQGKICRQTKSGKLDCMKYESFRRKVRTLLSTSKQEYY